MSKRTFNPELLRKWLVENDPVAKAKLSLGAQVSESLINKLLADTYGTVPKDYVRERICTATGIKEDELFPLVSRKGRKAAS